MSSYAVKSLKNTSYKTITTIEKYPKNKAAKERRLEELSLVFIAVRRDELIFQTHQRRDDDVITEIVHLLVNEEIALGTS